MAESRESPQLNTKHRQINPSFSARLCAFVDLFAGIKPNLAPVAVGFDALAVQYGGARLGITLFIVPNAGAQDIMESRPGAVQTPRAEDVIDGLPRRILFWQKPPWNAT